MAKILHNQSILDIAIQHTGHVQNAFAIAVANGKSVSDDLFAGDDLIIPQTVLISSDIVSYYSAKNIQPATGLTVTENASIPVLRGIGYMSIGKTFKVS